MERRLEPDGAPMSRSSSFRRPSPTTEHSRRDQATGATHGFGYTVATSDTSCVWLRRACHQLHLRRPSRLKGVELIRRCLSSCTGPMSVSGGCGCSVAVSDLRAFGLVLPGLLARMKCDASRESRVRISGSVPLPPWLVSRRDASPFRSRPMLLLVPSRVDVILPFSFLIQNWRSSFHS